MLHSAGCSAVLVGALATLFLSLMTSDTEAARRYRRLRPRAAESASQKPELERVIYRAHRKSGDWILIDQKSWPYKPPAPDPDVQDPDTKAYCNYPKQEGYKVPLYDSDPHNPNPKLDIQSNLKSSDLWPASLPLTAENDKDWIVERHGTAAGNFSFRILHAPSNPPARLTCPKKDASGNQPYYKTLQEVIDKKVLEKMNAEPATNPSPNCCPQP